MVDRVCWNFLPLRRAGECAGDGGVDELTTAMIEGADSLDHGNRNTRITVANFHAFDEVKVEDFLDQGRTVPDRCLVAEDFRRNLLQESRGTFRNEDTQTANPRPNVSQFDHISGCHEL